MNKLLLYLLLVLVMILFAHMLDNNIQKKYIIKNHVQQLPIREPFDIGNSYEKYIGSVVRLKVNLPVLNTHINGFNELVENKHFYLACVKLNPNCNVINVNNSCVSVFVDHKLCNNNGLSIESNKDTHRLVLLHESQIDMPDLSNTCNFVFEKINDKIYLKNIQNGHYPRLFTNNVYISVVGESIDINRNSNILCGNGSSQSFNNDSTTSGIHNLDGNTYLLSTMNSNTSSPVKLTFNDSINGNSINGNSINGNSEVSDTVSIQLEKYNNYGQVYDYHDLIYTNKVETSSIYTVNTVSIDNHIKRLYPSNRLQFIPEVISPSPEFVRHKFIKGV
jgi:hypothetical protein